MGLENVKTYLEKELNKISQKTSTSVSDQELLGKILCNYGYVMELCDNNNGYSSKMYHGKSNHSMRDKEIASLEEKINNATSDYEREFYRKLIMAAQDYRE